MIGGGFAGLNIRVVPNVLTKRLTWRERLLAWPWRPWQSTRMVPNPACPPDGEFYVHGGTAHCSQRTYDALKREVGDAPPPAYRGIY